MGNTCSSCCGSKIPPSYDRGHGQTKSLITDADRSNAGYNEPALAESEREAVADLLQYLENVSLQDPDFFRTKVY